MFVPTVIEKELPVGIMIELALFAPVESAEAEVLSNNNWDGLMVKVSVEQEWIEGV